MKKIKYLLAFSLMSCFTLMMGAGILSAEGTNSQTANSYNTNSTTGGNYQTNAVNDDNRHFDWGWLGLLGLIGLAGARGRNHDRNPERSRS